MQYQNESGSENVKAVVVLCILFTIAIGGSIWWWLSSGKFSMDNPGLSELQSRRAIRGCLNGEMWAFIEHAKTMGEVYGQKDGKYLRMKCRPGVEADGLAMREVCINNKNRGGQFLYGPWKNESFEFMSKSHDHGEIVWHNQPCRHGTPAAESFYQ